MQSLKFCSSGAQRAPRLSDHNGAPTLFSLYWTDSANMGNINLKEGITSCVILNEGFMLAPYNFSSCSGFYICFKIPGFHEIKLIQIISTNNQIKIIEKSISQFHHIMEDDSTLSVFAWTKASFEGPAIVHSAATSIYVRVIFWPSRQH